MCDDFTGLYFGNWQKWYDATNNDWKRDDVPEGFGIFGVYLFANLEPDEIEKPFETANMPRSILYIGMSSHIDQRLSSTHQAIEKYLKLEGKNSLEKLYVMKGYTTLTNNIQSRVEGQAYTAYWERLLLLNYVKAYKEFPILNSQ